jgi:hypothetical protein
MTEDKVHETEEPTEESTEEMGTDTVTEEIKVQAQDLFQTLNDIIREGTAKRITIMRNDRILVDIPVTVGVAASMLMAIYMPIISAIVAVGALLSGCTLRIERNEPTDAE